MTAYDEVLARRLAGTGPLQLEGGSGYFAARSTSLDPALFVHDDQLRPEVRELILGTLYRFWRTLYAAPEAWSTAWIAGSGITTAWNADREGGDAPGDLDVLIGVDYPSFYRWNPDYQGNSEQALAHHFNQQLHDGLWGSTDHTRINGSTYELTFYVNPGGTDIRDINPYAAYNVSADLWTVHPVAVPEGFSEMYFRDDERHAVAVDAHRAGGIAATYNQQLRQLAQLHPDDPRARNVAAALHQTVREGAGLFDVIHNGRHAAFAPGGKGYFDFANYRWQGGKASGAVNAMRKLKQLDEAAHRDLGTPCGDVGHLTLLAALVNGGRHS